MSDYKKALENKLKEGNIKCPDCNCKNIGIDKLKKVILDFGMPQAQM